jgi:hypothetical protein
MLHRTLKDEYKNQKEKLEDYNRESRFARWGYRFSKIAFLSFFVVPFILSALQYDVDYLINPNNRLGNILFTILTIIIFLAPFIWLYSSYSLRKIRKNHDYLQIKREFVFAYESINSYYEYLVNPQRLIDKNKAKSKLDKTFLLIRKWNYGNIKLILNKYKNELDFIINDLHSLLKEKIDKDDPAIDNQTYYLLLNLVDFLYQNDESTLNKLYNIAIKEYDNIVTDNFYKFKNMARNFVMEHTFSSYILIIGLGIIIYTISMLILGVEIKNIRDDYLALIGVLFLLFEAFKQYYLEID